MQRIEMCIRDRQNAEQAGKSAAAYSAKERRLIEITPGDGLLYAVPQRLSLIHI